MATADLMLIRPEALPASFFEEFENDLQAAGLVLESESAPSEVQAGVEAYLPAAISIFLLKPFVDEFLKRAAQDVNDAVYPKAKEAFAKLLKRIFVSPRPIKFIGTPGKVTHPEASMIALHARTRKGHEVKFIFLKTLAENEYENAVDKLFSLLLDHHGGTASDDTLSANVPTSSWKPILMTYDSETEGWIPYDPRRDKE